MKSSKLQQELKKRHPFASVEQEAVLNLFRTSNRIQIRFEQLFRKYELTPSQYNILRILRGESKPLSIMEIAGRTITEVPGITGLIDRLERCKLVRRQRSTEDRRVVNVSITPKAVELLTKLDEPLMQLHRDVLGHMTQQEMETLVRLLEKARETCESAP